MAGKQQKVRGVSTEVNWDVFRYTLVLYIASAWFCALLISFFNTLQDETTPILLGFINASLGIGFACIQLCPKVSLLEVFTTFGLGTLCGIFPGLLMSQIFWVPLPLQLYLCSVSIAHLFEYLFVCGYHPDQLDFDSYLINQSLAYGLAHMFALAEYFVELLLVPESLKFQSSAISAFGVSMIAVGHCFRIGAMFTAAQSFHHQVQYEKAPEHTLVTSGVYQLVRHPSYFGWTLWAVGTQVMLVNPVSILGFIAASNLFFRDRIPHEEELLVEFFGEAYIKYAITTPIWLPFIESYIQVKDTPSVAEDGDQSKSK